MEIDNINFNVFDLEDRLFINQMDHPLRIDHAKWQHKVISPTELLLLVFRDSEYNAVIEKSIHGSVQQKNKDIGGKNNIC